MTQETENNNTQLNEDILVRATAFNGKVAAVSLRHTNTCKELTKIHDLSPVACVALGRLCGGALLMSTDLKSQNSKLSITTKSDGELNGMVAACGYDSMVRGYSSNPRVATVYKADGKLDIGKAVGKGTLTVIKDLGLKEPYIGKTELLTGEIAEDLAAYFMFSEQIPTVISLGVKLDKNGVSCAGGLMVRLLPNANGGEEILSYIEQRALGFPDITWLYEEGFTPHQIIDLFMGDPDVKYLDVKECGYRCTCSSERMSANLITLGKSELEDMSQIPEGINLECHFCNSNYHFSKDDLKKIADSINN